MSRIRCGELPGSARRRAEYIVFTDLSRWKPVSTPPVLAVTERRAEGVRPDTLITPPITSIGEEHGAIADDGSFGFEEVPNLIVKPARCAVIVIVPVGDDAARRMLDTAIALFANLAPRLNVDKPYAWIIGNEIAHVLAVRHDQQFAIRICLLLEALDGFREP